MKNSNDPWAVRWSRGRILTLLAGFCFLGLCILTPLAGPSAVLTLRAARSGGVFLAAALLSCATAGLAWRRCRKEKIPQLTPFLLSAASLLFLLAHLFGFFR